MARVPSLFFNSDSEKQSLHIRIIPNSEQRKEQQERWNELKEFLIEDLHEKTGYPVSSWLQGSYKFGTQVRPATKGAEFDIDLGIYFEWSGSRDSGDYSPEELKSIVNQSIKEYAEGLADAVMEEPKERCARVKFSGDFHIDVPCYHLERDEDHRSLATETNGWEDSDPKAFYKWFRDSFSDEENIQIRRLIRYFKIWSQLNIEAAPSSILLTVLVAEAYQKLSEEQVDGDDLAFLSVAQAIYDRLTSSNTEVKNPAIGADEDLNRMSAEELEIFLGKLEALISLSEAALSAPSAIETSAIWSRAFKHFFPAPEVSEEEVSKSLVAYTFSPEVNIFARAIVNGGVVVSGKNELSAVPVGCSIHFEITNSQHLPQSSTVQWIVRNEGRVAEYHNDMGHFAGNNVYNTEERSAYPGTHYMDIEVWQYGRIIGFRRIPVKINGIIPVRNPQKPSYTLMNRRRR